MTDSSSHSITVLIENLKNGRQDAASKLWDRYFTRLVSLAHQKLGNAERRTSDEEDLAIDVFHSLCSGAAEGRFNELQTRDDLWPLLIAITSHKAVDQIRRQTSQKRGSGEVRGHSLFNHKDSETNSFDELLGDRPTPELMVSMNEQCQHLIGLLHDDKQKEIVRLKLEGYLNKEIAAKIGISLRSVERKLELIREIWLHELDSEA